MAISFKLSQAPTNAAYGSHERKAAQYGEELRRRGRRASAANDNDG
jgi:hypothetical protein